MTTIPIANKYSDGKLKRTLKRELNQYVKPPGGLNGWTLEARTPDFQPVGRASRQRPRPVVRPLAVHARTAGALVWISRTPRPIVCVAVARGGAHRCDLSHWRTRGVLVTGSIVYAKSARPPHGARITLGRRRAAQRRVGRCSTRPVLKHGPRSLTCARVIGNHECQTRNESEGIFYMPRGDVCQSTASPGRTIHLVEVRTKSVHVGTRKMVNYAWPGRSQRKLWWRSVAILTCKSIV